MIINATYDSSVTSLSPTLQAQYEAAVAAAVKYYDQLIANPITVNITFSYGEIEGQPVDASDAGESDFNTGTYSYQQLLAAAQATDTTSSVQTTAAALLPATDPTNGAGTFVVNTAEAKVLGLSTYGVSVDGYVGLSSALSYSWSQSSIAGGTYDAVGLLEHEISEVLGRTDELGVDNQYTLLDFYHYTAAGGSTNAAPGSAAGALDEPFVANYNSNAYSYFSYNGTTVTLPYDTPAQVAQGEDVADWTDSLKGDSYGTAYDGKVGAISQADLEEMNVLGYSFVNTISQMLSTTSLSGGWNSAMSLGAPTVSVSSTLGALFQETQLTTELKAADGSFNVGAAGAATITGAGTGDMKIAGTVAAIDAALATATYQANLFYSGTDTISVTTTDAGGDTPATNNIAVTLSASTSDSIANVSSAAALSADIKAVDLASQAGNSSGVHYSLTLSAGATLTEAADLEAINLKGGDTLTINGAGATLNGAGAFRGFFVYSGNVTIENLTIFERGGGRRRGRFRR